VPAQWHHLLLFLANHSTCLPSTKMSHFRDRGNYRDVSLWCPGGWWETASCQLNWTPAQTEKKARTLQAGGSGSAASMATVNDVNKEARCARCRKICHCRFDAMKFYKQAQPSTRLDALESLSAFRKISKTDRT